jgi:hypothetical protein
MSAGRLHCGLPMRSVARTEIFARPISLERHKSRSSHQPIRTQKGETMFSGYKTYIAGALTILGALGGFLTGNLAPDQAINLVVPAILAMTVRHGVSTASAS